MNLIEMQKRELTVGQKRALDRLLSEQPEECFNNVIGDIVHAVTSSVDALYVELGRAFARGDADAASVAYAELREIVAAGSGLTREERVARRTAERIARRGRGREELLDGLPPELARLLGG